MKKPIFMSIVIAIYNEEACVKELTERIYASMSRLKIPFELIYVVDGTDDSTNILKKIQKDKSNLILDYSPKLRGFKNSFARGFALASKKATHILTMDGDLNHQPEEIKNLLESMENEKAGMVIGSRYVAKGRMGRVDIWKKLISLFANRLINFIMNTKVNDKTSGFRLYKKELIDMAVPKCRSDNFEFVFEILLIAKMHNFKIAEVPIDFKPRRKGVSKFRLWKSAKGYLKILFRNYSARKPLVTRWVANKRASLILNYLKKLDRKNIKILDVGCGDRHITDLIKNKGYNIIGIDKHMPNECEWMFKKPDYVMDAENMGFKDNSFDVTIALEVIEHSNCLPEIKRVLNQGGIFFCSTPSPNSDWIRKVLIRLGMLENQDFESHDNIIHLRKVPMKLLKYKNMFLGTSQFGVFCNK